jgi:hypothetical protein
MNSIHHIGAPYYIHLTVTTVLSTPVEHHCVIFKLQRIFSLEILMPYGVLKVNKCFRGTCRLCLQGQRISEARNQQEAGSRAKPCLLPVMRAMKQAAQPISACHMLCAGFFLGLCMYKGRARNPALAP